MAAQPSRTVTMLLTDIEGSTRLVERLGRASQAAGCSSKRFCATSGKETP
jgi:class 3 adenylate cyclase